MKKIAKIDEIPRNGSKLVMINDKPIALFNLEGRIIAWDNRCPHRGASLADSHISEDIIQCKFHLWEFDTHSECSVANPAIEIKSYPIELKDGYVFLNEKNSRDL